MAYVTDSRYLVYTGSQEKKHLIWAVETRSDGAGDVLTEKSRIGLPELEKNGAGRLGGDAGDGYRGQMATGRCASDAE